MLDDMDLADDAMTRTPAVASVAETARLAEANASGGGNK